MKSYQKIDIVGNSLNRFHCAMNIKCMLINIIPVFLYPCNFVYIRLVKKTNKTPFYSHKF